MMFDFTTLPLPLLSVLDWLSRIACEWTIFGRSDLAC